MRVVSLCPSTTETLFALGRGADLVGVTKFCVQPAPAVHALEKVGGTKDPDLTRIIELAPDLVLMNREENRIDDAQALERAGLRVRASMPQSVSDVVSEVLALGAELGARPIAEALAARIQQKAERLVERMRGRPPLRVAYLIWRKPWMAAGSPSYIDDLLGLAGADNVFSQEHERYPSFEAERLADAQAVLLSSEPFPFRSQHIAELAALSGLSKQRFLLVDGQDFSWHGVRTLRALVEVERVFEILRRTL